MRRSGRVGLVLGVWLLAMGNGRAGLGLQRNGGGGSGSSSSSGTLMNGGSLPSASDAASRGGSLGASEFPFDAANRQAMEEKRAKMVMSERQRMMVKEADQILQSAAELQASLSGTADPSREETFRKAEAIEKLARNVKDRMKGTR